MERLNTKDFLPTRAPRVLDRGPRAHLARALARALALTLFAASCADRGPNDTSAASTSDASVDLDAGDPSAATDAGDADSDADAPPPPERICPPEMVRVARRFCVDRFEAVLVDFASGQTISPDYPPSRKLDIIVENTWKTEIFNMGDAEDQAVPLPLLPGWQKKTDFEPRAVSKKGALPNGYTTGKLAELACKNAGKRLCSLDEWRTACRGEQDLPFPYGDKYVQGKCNVFREGHPAMELHNDASKGHADPRLNRVKINGKALLRHTGDTPACVSVWEGEAIHDMVGNLDEWIDDPEGTFVGGFFSRSTKNGCAATITGHPYQYFDYSTGTRCCADLPEK